ncbi:AAA domain-containing protein [Nitrospinae bacterium]|nr:AAA domain-containing protein [Nitrospinota bacterium]
MGTKPKQSRSNNKNQFDRKKFDGESPIEQMILGLSDEIEYADENLYKQRLKNGEFKKEMGGLFVYQFHLDCQFEFNPDDSLAVAIKGKDYRGKVVQVDLGSVLIGVEEDHGIILDKVVIAKAESAMEKFLQKQLVAVFEKQIPFNNNTATFVINPTDAKVSKKSTPPIINAFLNANTPPWKLNKEQSQFIQIAQESEFCMLWGPPGCGKTTIIGLLVAVFLAEGKRVLAVSNSNKAVDGTLDAILETHSTIAKHSKRYDKNKTIIRPGSDGITQEFRDKWGTVSLLEEVIKSKTTKLNEEYSELSLEKKKLDLELKIILSQLELFEDYKIAKARSLSMPEELKKIKDELTKQKNKLTKVKIKVHELEEEFLGAPVSETLITRIGLGRAKPKIDEEIRSLVREEKALQFSLGKAQDLLSDKTNNQEKNKNTLLNLSEKISQLKSEEKLSGLRDQIEPVLSKIKNRILAINKNLDEIENSILCEADVIGTTVHKTFLDPTLSKLGFDVVIIDEASMVVLPMTYWVAGRSNKQVIVVGDFKQLPAIIKDSSSELVNEWIAKTPFDKCGIRETVKKSKSENPFPGYFVALKEQNRMHIEVGELVSRQFYEESLVTGDRVHKRNSVPRLPGQKTDKRLVLIDTKEIGAWSSPSFSGKSRFNPTHVALGLSLIDKLILEGQLKADQSKCIEQIGYVTPYAGQAELFLKATKEKYRQFIHESSIGTIHKFQGSERNIIIFDYVISEARTYPSQFLDSEDGEDQPGNLLNVAISRAREHLVLIYNSEDFNERATHQWMLQFFADFSKNAEHLNASVLLDESGFKDRVQDIAHGRKFVVDHPTVLHEETGFHKGVRHDLRNANDSVVIFSAFATPGNLSPWLDLFQILLEKNIKIRLVTKPISEQPKPKTFGPQLKAIFDKCRKAGITIDMRTVTHEKAVIIDNQIVWHGSLNMLSQKKDRTAELMTRTVSKDFAEQILKLLSRHDLKQVDPSKPQLPVCPTCNEITELRVSWQKKETLWCGNDCGFITGNWGLQDIAKGLPIGKHLGDCPKCKDGILKVYKNKEGLVAQCSNRREKKCTHENKVRREDLEKYEPFPQPGKNDPGILDDLIQGVKKDAEVSTCQPTISFDQSSRKPSPAQKNTKNKEKIKVNVVKKKISSINAQDNKKVKEKTSSKSHKRADSIEELEDFLSTLK